MDPMPLVTDEIEAGAEFLRRLDALRPVTTACWLREDDESESYLNVSLEGLTEGTVKSSYDLVRRAVNDMKERYFDPFRVRLITPDDPVAKSVADIYRRYPGRTPSRWDAGGFGGLPATELYIYPPLHVVV